MKYLNVISVIYLLITLSSALPIKNGVPLSSLGKQVDALAAHLIRCRRLPGLTIAVARATAEGGRQVLTRSYGVADVSTNRTVDVNTRFCLAGITQSFTAATLTQLLHENNSFSLDSTLQSMLGTWFQLSEVTRTRRVTVRDILSHRVGLAPYFGGVVLGYNFTRIELIRRLRHIPVMAPFRHSFVPNPLLYVLAGHLVQNLNGTFWENVVMRRLFKTLHMTGSTFADRVPNWAANFALPHVLRDGQLLPISSKITGNILRPVGPSNSICSSAPDMAEWMLMLLRNGTSHGDPVLDPSVIAEMFNPQNTHLPGMSKQMKGTLPVNITTDAYNLGWFSGSYRGHRRVFQNGFANYFGSFLTLFPDDGLGIFTAANGPSLTGMDNAFRALHYSIADLAMGESTWLNESSVCTYPKPWIMSSKNPVKSTANENKTTKVTADQKKVISTTTHASNITENDSNNINNNANQVKITSILPSTNKMHDTTSPLTKTFSLEDKTVTKLTKISPIEDINSPITKTSTIEDTNSPVTKVSLAEDKISPVTKISSIEDTSILQTKSSLETTSTSEGKSTSTEAKTTIPEAETTSLKEKISTSNTKTTSLEAKTITLETKEFSPKVTDSLKTKITEDSTVESGKTDTTTINSIDYDAFLVSTPFEIKKLTTNTEPATKIKNNSRKTTSYPKRHSTPIIKRNYTIGNDVTSQSRLSTLRAHSSDRLITTTEFDDSDILQTTIKNVTVSRPLVYVSSTSFRRNRTSLQPTETTTASSVKLFKTRPILFPVTRTRPQVITRPSISRHFATTKGKTTSTTTSTTTTAKPKIIGTTTSTEPISFTSILTTSTSTKPSVISIVEASTKGIVEDFDDDITFDDTFGLRLPTDFDTGSDQVDLAITTLKSTKNVKKLPTFPSRLNQNKTSVLRKPRPTYHFRGAKPSTSSFGLIRPTKHQTFPGNERENTIGHFQQSESILIPSSTPHPRISPNWIRRNQSQQSTSTNTNSKISELDEIVMKYISSTTPTTKQTDDFNAFILTNHPLSTMSSHSSTISPKMDYFTLADYFSDVSTSTKKNPIDDYLLEDMETMVPPSKIMTIFTSGQFPVLEGTQSSPKEFKNSPGKNGNDFGFNFPQSFGFSNNYAITTTRPTLQIPKRQRLLFSSKRRLSGQHRQSRRSTFNYQSVMTSPTPSLLIEDDITETLLKFGVRLARRHRLKREGKLPALINPFPNHVATYENQFFGNIVIFYNKTSGTLQMEYGFYGKAHLIPYVQSNTFLLRFFSAVWYVSESDDSRRLPRSVFLVHFKGFTPEGKPERFIMPFFDPRLPPIFIRVKPTDKK